MKIRKLFQLCASQRSTEGNVLAAEKWHQFLLGFSTQQFWNLCVKSLFFSPLRLTKLFSFWMETYLICALWFPKDLVTLLGCWCFSLWVGEADCSLQKWPRPYIPSPMLFCRATLPLLSQGWLSAWSSESEPCLTNGMWQKWFWGFCLGF